MFQGIPENAEVPPVAQTPAGEQPVNPPVQASQPVAPTVPSGGGPNANPLDIFPQVCGLILKISCCSCCCIFKSDEFIPLLPIGTSQHGFKCWCW